MLAHKLAEPEKGTGIAMVCTFGDLTDITWWRELALDTRAVIGRDGRFSFDAPGRLTTDEAAPPTPASLARPPPAPEQGMVELLRESGDLLGEPKRSPIPSSSTRRATGRWRSSPPASGTSATAVATRTCGPPCSSAGRRSSWHPEYMRYRYETGLEG